MMVKIGCDDAIKYRKVLEKMVSLLAILQNGNVDYLQLNEESSLHALIRALSNNNE